MVSPKFEPQLTCTAALSKKEAVLCLNPPARSEVWLSCPLTSPPEQGDAGMALQKRPPGILGLWFLQIIHFTAPEAES